ncbi:MAG: chromosome segregation protein SMC [Sulfurimonas sp. RIFOXYD12_FULL_33_39]|uniref:AAA family ATPase n=1 Tax=unclassified Sulfurimonas TaxID=2623549 RepID=UPI0008D4F2BB|nr:MULTISPECIES: SMC family ATPase [unclassified Sulfurimonas]OHE06746.1 MAG: chromosome segregation protein SMC [Sulfurimonas sp. RIFCSPLOWO2_12_FULL_34_6]OHE08831.1 MAG: chromosome segregation protein SMC [Sulfurimonas sp. RIFOXYD12_FULL_33_39]OHE14141.1 MAG: chromosome segregation protein SMC [Sulfurimonas sp. RIFOXYD2_FULL_34_21]DAB28615.1 MAG TPA: chromosome segregation protein SMC [Sulfurimonas sp. UBA10385]
MILSKLHLENFKKYTSYDIEFGEGLIGIIGKNGSGKSTIFEAILFALYGELKNKGYKDIVRNANASDKDSVVVELIFEFDGVQFRVVREFRGKALTANAKLYKNEELTTSGAKEVTSAIVKLTKMSKDAFMHTLFASQKELTSLSTLKNEDRKKMIRKLLGLEKIDFIENSLVERSRELKREIEAFKEILLGEDEIKQKEQLIKESLAAKEALAKDAEQKSKELEEIKTKVQHVKKELELFAKTKEQKQKLLSELELIKNSKSLEILNQVKLTAELHELEDKQEKLDALKEVKTEYMSLQESLKDKEKLKEIYLKKEGVKKEQIQLREQYIKSKADIHTLEKETENYDEFVLNAKNLEINIAMLQESVTTKHTIENELLVEIAGEQKQIATTNEKIEKLQELGNEGTCPTCTRPLLEEYDNVVNSLALVVNETHQKKIDEYKKQLQNVTEQKNAFEADRKAKEKEFLELTKNINIMESKLKDLKKAKEYFLHVEQKGIQNKNELEELEKFSYNDKLHEEIRKSFALIEPKYKLVLSLETELKRVALVKSDLLKVNKKIEELSSARKAKEAEFNLVVYDEAKHKEKQKEHDEAQKNSDEKTTLLNEVKIKIATCEGEIKSVQNSLENNEIQLKKVQTKKDDLVDYEKIKVSLAEFKTRLNAKVAPRISSLASDMYAQITKGKYQHIEVSNDFDFFIYDEGKKYPIERYSGGEVDLANLVLRIAISKTLTELSGASSIGFLAFDEVFGSQDESRRMEILEAFHTIKEQYRQIFLISHEMEIKEMFERVVEL